MNSLLLLLPPAVGLVLGAVCGIGIRRLAAPRIARWTARTALPIDDVLIATARSSLPLWGALLGAHIGVNMSDLSAHTRDTLSRVIIVLLGLSVSWTVARLTGALVRSGGGGRAALPSARVLDTIAQVGVFVLGALVTLSTIGISTTPVLAALGVGGLAVGLALQDTLANLFAGFHLLVSRQVRPGDFVRLASGEEGYVEDITWRYTTIRRLPNDLVIVPNAELASGVTSNFSLPENEQAVLVEVAVSYDADLEHVEHVTVEVAREVQHDVAGGVPEFAPLVRFHSFGESGVGFTVMLRARHYTDQYLLTHEFVKRLHHRYRVEQITIPSPHRTVRLERPRVSA